MTQTTQWVAYGDGRLRFPDGTVEQFDHSLPMALSLAEGEPRARAQVGVTGDHSRPIDVGGKHYVPPIHLGDKPWAGGWQAFRAGGIEHVDVVGLDESAIAPPLYLLPKYCSVNHVAWKNLYVRCSEGRYAGVMHAMGHTFLDLDYEDIEFINDWEAYWGFRRHGPTQGKTVRCYGRGFWEHGDYSDNPVGDVTVEDCQYDDCRRTAWQYPNRIQSGPPATGTLTFRGCVSRGCGEHGGGVLTVAGHLGTVVVKDCDLVGGQHAHEDTYALNVWGEGVNEKTGNLGAHHMEVGGKRYAVNRLLVHPRQRFHSKGGPTKGRPAVGISSVNTARVGPCKLDGGPGSPDLWLSLTGQSVGDFRFVGRGNAWNWKPMWSANPPEGKIKRGKTTLGKAAVGELTGAL